MLQWNVNTSCGNVIFIVELIKFLLSALANGH